MSPARHDRLPPGLESLLPPPLHALCEPRRVERGSRLFEAGRRPASKHFVSDGEVVLQRLGEDGELVVLQRTGHGFVGEASLLHLVRTEGGASGLPLGAGLKTLARGIGVTHEALYRGVAALSKRGLLVREGGRLRLRAPVPRVTR